MPVYSIAILPMIRKNDDDKGTDIEIVRDMVVVFEFF
jgi:hypothetical protein